jgi:sugar lactone lactonase YvrE
MAFYLRSRRISTMFLFVVLLACGRDAHAQFSATFQGNVQTLNTGGSITLSSPSGIVVDSAGDIFIADTVSGSGRIVEVNAQGTASVLTISGLSPALGSLSGIAIDGAGNLYIADTSNTRVVKVTSSGAGSVFSTGSVTLTAPHGVAVDQSGDLFISDGTSGSSRIVEVTSGGSAAALTINVSSGSASLSSPEGLAVDVSGKLYIADSANNRIVTVATGTTTGVVLTTNGFELSHPSSVAVDRIGNVFIADTGNNRIVEVEIAGDGDVLMNSAFLQATTFSGPLGVAVDVFGGVYVADTGNSRALVVDPSLGVDDFPALNKTAVGFGHISLGSSTPTSFILSFSVGFSIDSVGSVNAFTSGTQNLDFQIVSGANTTCSGAISGSNCTVEISFLPTAPGLRNGALVLYDAALNPALTVPLYGFGDAPVAALSPNTGTVIGTGVLTLSEPYQVALDGAGNMYVGDYSGSNVTKIPAAGGAATVVSLGTPGSIPVQDITGVAVDGAGNLYIGDHQNSRILVVTPNGVVSVLSISGLSPVLGYPTALAFDAAGSLYIADFTNGRIVEVSSLFVTGSTSTGIGTVIPTGSYSFSGSTLTGLTIDPQGNIYAAARTDNDSSIIKVTASGVVSALAIPNNITPALNNPQGVAADAMGNIYIADTIVNTNTNTTNSRIVKITTAGVASVLSLSGQASSLASSVFGVTVDPFGNLYIPDWNDNRLVFVNVSGAPLTFPTPTGSGTTDTADGPQTATVTNLGNRPLAFSANPTYTADFSSNGNDTDPCTSSTSLSPGTVCDVSVNFTPQSVGSLITGITVTNNTLNVTGSTEQVSVSGTGLNSNDSTATTVTTSPTSLVFGQTVTITATVADTATGHTSNSPTGSVTFTDTVNSAVTSLNNGAAVNLNNKTASLTGVVLSGTGTHTITANYSGNEGQYVASSNAATVVVSQASVTVTLTSSASSVVLTNPLVFTATVSSTTTTPTGTVSFLDGTTTLGQGVLSNGVATLSTSSLAAGNHTITAVYSGNANFSAATSGALTEAVLDFSLSNVGGSGGASGSGTSASQTVTPGGTASYPLTILPTNGTVFPAPITLSLTGVPSGATANIVPSSWTQLTSTTWSLPANSVLSATTLAIQTPSVVARLEPGAQLHRTLPPVALGFLLLPLAGLRRLGKTLGRTIFTLLLLAVGASAMAGLSGCEPTSGLFTQPSQTYTMTVTATSGTLSHATTVTLTIK